MWLIRNNCVIWNTTTATATNYYIGRRIYLNLSKSIQRAAGPHVAVKYAS